MAPVTAMSVDDEIDPWAKMVLDADIELVTFSAAVEAVAFSVKGPIRVVDPDTFKDPGVVIPATAVRPAELEIFAIEVRELDKSVGPTRVVVPTFVKLPEPE